MVDFITITDLGWWDEPMELEEWDNDVDHYITNPW
jgi:hypothetical protein